MSAKDIGFAEQAVVVDVSGGNQTFALGTRAFYIGGAGNFAVVMWDGAAVTFAGLTAGSILPIRAASVVQTGTTATNVLALL